MTEYLEFVAERVECGDLSVRDDRACYAMIEPTI